MTARTLLRSSGALLLALATTLGVAQCATPATALTSDPVGLNAPYE
ncbi:hypothetical protein [Kitasatospora sp. MMS16-BH015]|nr:hypothetical protein [Kitasatospora sp. MMS16-BH015]